MPAKKLPQKNTYKFSPKIKTPAIYSVICGSMKRVNGGDRAEFRITK
jgi:hypothetical protein